MANTLSLPTLQALANATTEYGGSRLLEPLSAVTILSFAAFLSQTDFWNGAGLELTQSELNEIDALIGQLVTDVLVDDGVDMDYELIGQEFLLFPQSSLTVSGLDSTDYDLYKVFITGARTNYGAFWTDSILMSFNSDVTPANYAGTSTFTRQATFFQNEDISTEPGIKLYWAAAAAMASAGIFGTSEITIQNTKDGEFSNVEFSTTISEPTTNLMGKGWGSGVYRVDDEITSITISPEAGTQFVMARLDPVLPEELLMSVYGIRGFARS